MTTTTEHAVTALEALAKLDLPAIRQGILDATDDGYAAAAAGFGTPGAAMTLDDENTPGPCTQPERGAIHGLNQTARHDLREFERASIDLVKVAAKLVRLASYAPHRAPKLLAAEADTMTDTWQEYDADDHPMWCKNCHTVGHKAPIRAGLWELQLCRWCNDFRLNHGALPGAELLRAHHEGRRITTLMIDRWAASRLHNQPPGSRKKSKKRKGR